MNEGVLAFFLKRMDVTRGFRGTLCVEEWHQCHWDRGLQVTNVYESGITGKLKA